jgi:hypothetical protein
MSHTCAMVQLRILGVSRGPCRSVVHFAPVPQQIADGTATVGPKSTPPFGLPKLQYIFNGPKRQPGLPSSVGKDRARDNASGIFFTSKYAGSPKLFFIRHHPRLTSPHNNGFHQSRFAGCHLDRLPDRPSASENTNSIALKEGQLYAPNFAQATNVCFLPTKCHNSNRLTPKTYPITYFG